MKHLSEVGQSDEETFELEDELNSLDFIPDVEIEYQEDDGNSDCGDSCTI